MPNLPAERPPSDFKLPGPVYPCADEVCSQEYSWPADDLSWIDNPHMGPPGFYCWNCVDHQPIPIELADIDGITLAEELELRATADIHKAPTPVEK